MNLKRWMMILSLIFLLIGSIEAQNAPESVPDKQDIPKVEFVRKTADGAFIVKIGTVQYRLLTADEYRTALINQEKVKAQREIDAVRDNELALNQARVKADIESLVAAYELNIANLKEQLANAEQRYENEIAINKKNKKINIKTVLKSPITNTVLNIISLLVRILQK